MRIGAPCRAILKQLLLRGVAFLFLASLAFAEGNVTSLKDFRYWDNGKIRDCTMYDTNGILKAKAFCRYDGTVEKVERYDKYGNKVEVANYDEKGKLKIGIDGWAAMRSWYDENNILRSQISYDENGLPIERKQYSEGGKLLLRQFRDDVKTEPYEEAMMATMLGGANMRYFVKESAQNTQ